MSNDKLYFFVDAIEGACARLLTDDGQSLEAPASAIPSAAREGDWLLVSFEIDNGRKSEMRREIEDLYGELGDNP
ncbi:MAG: DUF3006 domain-containing protein [Synergistaceae bacterium]|jgi:hypothetical protein|nr:DUF3006 domain-containing protein [Synergistaceae bacterium]